MAEVEGPIDPQTQRVLYAVARAIKDFVIDVYPDREMGFLVAVFDRNENGKFNYMSDSNREDIIKLLEEMLVKFKGS